MAISADNIRDQHQRVDEHFGTMSQEYDATIARSFPAYQETFDYIFKYISLDHQAPLHIVDLGCGTGNLSKEALKYFPNAHLTLVDIAPEMLSVAEEKIKGFGNSYQLLASDLATFDLPESSVDLVISSIAIHHLSDADKKSLYPRIYRWLKPGGQFRCGDGVFTLPKEHCHPLVHQGWADWAKQYGATEDDVAMWLEHEKQYDHHVPLRTYLQWLDEAGFEHVDCYWKKLLWAVFGGQKPLVG